MDGSRICESTKATSASSTHPSTRDEWIASQADSLARTLARLEKAGVLTASARAFGPSSLVSLATFDPDSHSLKTVQCSLFEDSTECSVTLPRWGSMRNGRLYRRPMLELCIGESGSGFLPTPTATPYGTTNNGKRGDLIQAVRGNPNSHYRMWQTPVADDAVDREKGKINSRGEPKLSAQVKMWPTPTLGDSRSSGSRNTETSKAHPGLSLTDAVRGDAGKGRMWPTPKNRDWKDGRSAGTKDRDSPDLGKVVGQSMESGSLNPHWVEWLMGWPLEWTRTWAESRKIRPAGGAKSPKTSRASRKASPIALPD